MLNTKMQDHEAILMAGTEQFSQPKGYSRSLTYGGPFKDLTPIHSRMRQSYIVAIDALNLRRSAKGINMQYTQEGVQRELTKAWAGFNTSASGLPVPTTIATGNWGCGVFDGDVALKSLIQLLACSESEKVMRYYPWDDARVQTVLPAMVQAMQEKGVTVGQLSSLLLHDAQPGDVFQQVNDKFHLGLQLPPRPSNRN
uniref:PARG catalytic Macro domain-containing protein n=1 Tax=Eutreptiella gymnastica TaxID=73025 RepID=A0A7S4CI82_9EUGL